MLSTSLDIPEDSGLFIKQAAKMGYSTTFLGGDAWDEIGKYAGPAINGSFQSTPWHPEGAFCCKSENEKTVSMLPMEKILKTTAVPWPMMR